MNTTIQWNTDHPPHEDGDYLCLCLGSISGFVIKTVRFADGVWRLGQSRVAHNPLAWACPSVLKATGEALLPRATRPTTTLRLHMQNNGAIDLPIPHDCAELVLDILPILVRVMRAGAGKKPEFHWRDVDTIRDQLEHAEEHGDTAAIGPGLACDESDNEPHRAHQIVRLMMALWLELRKERER